MIEGVMTSLTRGMDVRDMLRHLVRPLEAAFRFFAILSIVLAFAFFAGAFKREVVIPRSAINAISGHAYYVTVPALFGCAVLGKWLYVPDSMESPTAARISLFRADEELGPPHSLHADIIKTGAGQFSYWNGALIFSAPDNSDPRKSGIYSITENANPARVLELPVNLALVLLIIRLFISSRQMTEVRFGIALCGHPLTKRAFDIGVLALCVVIPIGLYLWQGPGPTTGNDAEVYVYTAKRLLAGFEWTNVPDFNTSAEPVTLLRLIGYPTFLAANMAVFGVYWEPATITIQSAFAVMAGLFVYRTLSVISGLRIIGAAGALLWMLTNRGDYDKWFLTDSLYTSVLTIGICMLIRLAWSREVASPLKIIAIAVCYGTMTFVREFTLLMTICAIPLLAISTYRGSLRAAAKPIVLFVAPTLAALLIIMTWNYFRIGYPVFSTGSEDAPLVRLIEAQQAGVPVFDGNDILSQEARPVLHEYTGAEARIILAELLRDHGLHAPEIAKLVSHRYFTEWFRHPVGMAEISLAKSEMVPDIFEPLALIDRASQTYDWGWASSYYRLLFYFCIAVLPLCWLLAAAVNRANWQSAALVWACWFYSAVPTLAYALIHFEIRYAMFAVASLLAIPAATTKTVLLAAKQAHSLVRIRLQLKAARRGQA